MLRAKSFALEPRCPYAEIIDSRRGRLYSFRVFTRAGHTRDIPENVPNAVLAGIPAGGNSGFAAAPKVFRGWLGRVYSLRVGEENMSMRMIFFSVISIGLAAGIAFGQTSGSTKDSKAKADYKVSPSIFEEGPSSRSEEHTSELQSPV